MNNKEGYTGSGYRFRSQVSASEMFVPEPREENETQHPVWPGQGIASAIAEPCNIIVYAHSLVARTDAAVTVDDKTLCDNVDIGRPICANLSRLARTGHLVI